MGISKLNGLYGAVVQELNQLESKKLRLGQMLLIPSNKNIVVHQEETFNHPPKLEKPNTYKVLHIVQKGETFKSLSEKYQVTSEEIREWNQIKDNQPLKKEQQLTIWKRPITSKLYTVKSGDSFNQIAKTFNLKAARLAQLNPNIRINSLKPGQQLVIQ